MCGGIDYPKIWGKNAPCVEAEINIVCSKNSKKATGVEVGREREEEECGRRRDPREIVFNLG